MASIDKIYGNKEQQEEFYTWCSIHKPEALEYFYPWEHEWLTDNLEHPITMLPEEIDRWLFNNCPINFVIKRIKEQYDGFCFDLDDLHNPY